MADELNSDFTATQEEIKELATGVAGGEDNQQHDGDEQRSPQHAVTDDTHGAVHEDPSGEDDEEEERTARVDAELAEAANDDERAAIRERRKKERQEKKNRQRERQQNLERQVQQLTRQNQEMAQNIALLSQHTAGAQMARLDEAIGEVDNAVQHFQGLIADATTKGDGTGVAQATTNLWAAQERAKELRTYKEALNKQRPTQNQRTVDPTVVTHAQNFMARHKWYAGPRATDMDSRVLSQIDNAVAQEGFDPTGPEYWQELETRAKRYLPHRFEAGQGASAGVKDGYNGRATGSDGERRPRQPVAGNSGDARGPKGGGEGYQLSAERVKAIKDAGKWDDPEARKKMIEAYKKYDKDHATR